MSNIAENAGDVVETIVENANSEIQAELDAANERAENAEIVAEQIAEAAIEGERGERIAEIQRGLYECQTQLAQSEDARRALEMQMREMQTTLSTILTSQASTPTPSPEPTPEVMELPITEEAAEVLDAIPADPLEASESVDAPPVVEVAVRKRRNWM